MRRSDFDYHLPERLIAQEPLAGRAESRMLVVDRARGAFRDAHFRELPGLLGPGDCLALNETRVIPARLLGERAGGGALVEVFLLAPLDEPRTEWEALVRPGKKLREGSRVVVSPTLAIDIAERRGARGERRVRLLAARGVDTELDACGHVPLPPYIRRADRVEDRERYQTVFAARPGSVAAPTAGLHFTPEVIDACRAAGADIARLVLHVGLGTFQPLAHERVEDNRLHAERFELGAEAAAKLRAARRIVACGTTTVRTLETAVRRDGLVAQSGATDLFVYPGFEFRATGALLTNFHLPQSSLLMLVCAFAGTRLVLDAYRHAVKQEYRFFSYGDSMLCV